MRRLLTLAFALTLTAQAADAQTHFIVLNWNPSPTAGVTYSVYRGTSPAGEGGTPIASGLASGCTNPTNCTFTDIPLPATTTYYYTVVAVIGSAMSGPSNEAYATTLADTHIGLFAIPH